MEKKESTTWRIRHWKLPGQRNTERMKNERDKKDKGRK